MGVTYGHSREELCVPEVKSLMNMKHRNGHLISQATIHLGQKDTDLIALGVLSSWGIH